MEKLILRYDWGGEHCGGTDVFPFLYKSKEEFMYDVLERFKNHKWVYCDGDQSKYSSNKVELFDNIWLSEGDINDIERNVHTLDEWFDLNTKGFEIEHKWKL